MSARTSRPTVAELRAATQPASIFERNSGEHWAGKLYVRRYSPYLTRALLGLTPNTVTWLMIAVGVAAAALLTLPGLAPAVGAFLLIQMQIALDCSDGEIARWKGISSPMGIYLDRIGHWLTETALPIGLGIRADGGWDSIGSWTTVGLIAAVLQLLVKGETALVFVARAEAGLGKVEDRRTVAAPQVSALARLRRFAGTLPFYRAFVAVEFSLLALGAAIVDAASDSLDGTRTLAVAMVVIGAVTALGHLLAIISSQRLR